MYLYIHKNIFRNRGHYHYHSFRDEMYRSLILTGSRTSEGRLVLQWRLCQAKSCNAVSRIQYRTLIERRNKASLGRLHQMATGSMYVQILTYCKVLVSSDLNAARALNQEVLWKLERTAIPLKLCL